MKSCRLAIYPEINVSYEKTNANASPAIYFDSYGHAVVPLLGGVAIRDLNAEETTTLGYFSPKQHDGGGLAWGGGCSPSLTPDLVMFTDNADPVKLLALDMKTGMIVASMPVLDDLPEGYQVAVENSAIVYDDSEGTVSTIACNWFGAGSAGLADPDSDSSIQSYANIYDMNWLTKGNCMIAPGVERVDTVKTDSGYEMKSIWSRNDLSDTSILKLSTATGYIYGYVQDLESGMWQYIILDFATGETVFTMDVSNKYG